LVSVGGGYDWWVGDVGGGDICVFAVDDGEEEIFLPITLVALCEIYKAVHKVRQPHF